MSFLTSIRAAVNPRLALRPVYATTSATSPFHTSTTRPGLKESDHNREDREDLGNVYEAEKHETLRSTKDGTATWKQELASHSEASVKADRGDIDDGDSKDFKDMQERTKHMPNKQGAKK